MRFIAFLFLVCLSFSLPVNAHEKKVIVITGASRGIGYATAKYLSTCGYCVYATGRTLQKGSSDIAIEYLDVTDNVSIQKCIGKIIKKEGRIDVLINNAAYALGGPVEHLSIEEAKSEFDTNFFGVMRMCQEVIPYMRAQGSGHIINISSEQGVYGVPYGTMYSASKAALESFSEGLSIELLPWNIHVSLIEPGLVDTQFSVVYGTRQLKDDPYKDIMMRIHSFQSQYKRKTPIPCQSPEDIAKCIGAVVTSPCPHLRYQTSEAAKERVSTKLSDLSGQVYTHALQKEVEFLLATPSCQSHDERNQKDNDKDPE